LETSSQKLCPRFSPTYDVQRNRHKGKARLSAGEADQLGSVAATRPGRRVVIRHNGASMLEENPYRLADERKAAAKERDDALEVAFNIEEWWTGWPLPWRLAYAPGVLLGRWTAAYSRGTESALPTCGGSWMHSFKPGMSIPEGRPNSQIDVVAFVTS